MDTFMDTDQDLVLSSKPEIPDSYSEILVPEISADILHDWLQDRLVTLVDVRDPQEFWTERLPKALFRPLDRLDPHEFTQFPSPIVLYCRSGKRSAIAGQRILSHHPIELVHLQGGILAWKAAGYSTVISDDTDSINTHSTAPATDS